MTDTLSKLNKIEQKKYVESYKAMMKRMNFNGNEYFFILSEAAKKYKTYEKEADDLFETCKKNGTSTLTWYLKDLEIIRKMKHEEFIAVTFAAMFLECIIWDYAAVNTSQSLIEDYLSKINLIGKWKIIPKLVNNDKNINYDSITIALLKKLIKRRNDIIHSKSKPVPDTYDEIKKEENKDLAISMNETVECVLRCMNELKKIDTTNYWYFENEDKFTAIIPNH